MPAEFIQQVQQLAQRVVQAFRRLPGWLQVSLSSVVAALALFGIAVAVTSGGARPEEPVATANGYGATSDENRVKASVSPTVLDAASATREVNYFTAQGDQQTVDLSEIPAVEAALQAFREANYHAGFVVYDFTSEQGLGYNADEAFFSASTVKAPYVVYVAQALIDQGEASFSDEIVEDLVVEGTGTMARDDVAVYDLGTVFTNTIVHSDNTGYALLRENYNEGFDAWALTVGVDAASWGVEWYPYYTPRDLAKLWLSVGEYMQNGQGQAAFCEDLLENTGSSFIRKALGEKYEVLAKAGYETDMPFYDTGALNDAGVVKSDTGDYLLVIMSDADYDDEYYQDTEPLILNLITALNDAHDQLLAA